MNETGILAPPEGEDSTPKSPAWEIWDRLTDGLMAEPEITDWLEQNHLQPEEVEALRKLLGYPNERWVGTHNQFSGSLQGYLADLRHLRDQSPRPDPEQPDPAATNPLRASQHDFYAAYVDLAERVDPNPAGDSWRTFWHLNLAAEDLTRKREDQWREELKTG